LANGTPFKSSEVLRLKLAGALLAKPAILVLNEYFDTLSYERRQRIFDYVCSQTDMIVLYFSNRHDLYMFDRYLFMDWGHNVSFPDVAALRNCDNASLAKER
jgi:putative ABC transport system ATP-binding protein